MDGARGRARAAILPRVHLSRENHEKHERDTEVGVSVEQNA